MKPKEEHMAGLSVKEKALREGLSKLRYCATNDGWQPFKPDEAAAILEHIEGLKAPAPKARVRKVAAKPAVKKAAAKPSRKR